MDKTAFLSGWTSAPLWRLQSAAEEQVWNHALPVRHSIQDPEEKAYCIVFAPREEPSLEMVAEVAGMRRRIEDGCRQAKDAQGSTSEVRKFAAWHRHSTLSVLAHAFLAVVAAREQKKEFSSLPDPRRTGGG